MEVRSLVYSARITLLTAPAPRHHSKHPHIPNPGKCEAVKRRLELPKGCITLPGSFDSYQSAVGTDGRCPRGWMYHSIQKQVHRTQKIDFSEKRVETERLHIYIYHYQIITKQQQNNNARKLFKRMPRVSEFHID